VSLKRFVMIWLMEQRNVSVSKKSKAWESSYDPDKQNKRDVPSWWLGVDQRTIVNDWEPNIITADYDEFIEILEYCKKNKIGIKNWQYARIGGRQGDKFIELLEKCKKNKIGIRKWQYPMLNGGRQGFIIRLKKQRDLFAVNLTLRQS